MLAAPNRCRIKARVNSLQRPAHFPDKVELEIEILETREVSGPNFARAGQTAQAFTFDPPATVTEGAIIECTAEFLGDPRGGRFQLTDIALAA